MVFGSVALETIQASVTGHAPYRPGPDYDRG